MGSQRLTITQEAPKAQPTSARARILAPILLACAMSLGCGASEYAPKHVPESFAHAPSKKKDAYPLDNERRTVRKKGKANCPQVQLVAYKGDVIPYHRPLRVNPFFRERLQHFELVVRDVSVKVYGRAPTKIRHFGAYLCRRIRGRSGRMSEHGLGNAIDVSGFEFGADGGAPAGLKGGFRIVLKQHWDDQLGLGATHARFLRELVFELSKRPDIFRGMIGPGASGHDDHFHFDMGRSRFMRFSKS